MIEDQLKRIADALEELVALKKAPPRLVGRRPLPDVTTILYGPPDPPPEPRDPILDLIRGKE